MLLRRWSTQVAPARIAEYEAFAMNTSLPMFRAHRGIVAVLMSRDGPRATVQTIWEDEASIRALERSPLCLTAVAEIQAAGFLEGEPRVEIERVHASAWPSP